MTIWHKLERIDRRILFVLVALSVIWASIRPMGLPLSVSPYTQMVFDQVEKLPKDAIVIMSPSYSPGSEAELLPQTQGVAVHAMRKGAKMLWVSLTADAPMYARKVMGLLAAEFKYEYGKDYIILPYKANEEASVSALGHDIRAMYKEDVDGKALDQLPLWSRVKTIKDVSLVLDFDTGTTMLTYIRLLGAPHGVPISGGGTGVQVPTRAPYIQGGQLQGMLGGLRGAAEYEKLINVPGRALAGMDAQSLTHAVVIIFIILGNLGGWMIGKSQKGGRR